MTHLGLLIYCTLNLFYAVSSLKTENRKSNETTVDGEMSGCHYKGRYFEDGMVVSVPDPCVQCRCYEKKLSCKLEICLEYPNLHQDCFRDKDPSKCCAQFVCKNGTNYESSFQNIAPSKKTTTINNCEINGTIYKNGDAVPSLDTCQQCYCIHKNIQCITQTCTLPHDLLLGCKPVLQKDSCCPSKYNCSKKKSHNENKKLGKNDENIIGCLYENKEYLDGDLITEESSPCEHCYCFKGEMICAEQNCSEPLPGCKPIMESGLCCPVRYECDKDGPLLIFNDKPISRKMDVKDHNMGGCFVEGKFYKHGSPINTSDSCEKCKCDETGEVSCELLQCQDLPTGIKNCSKPMRPECCPIQKCTCTHIAHKEELVAIPQVICEACWSNGTLYHPGDVIKSATSCQICFCTEHGIRCDEHLDCEIPKHVYYSQNCTPVIDPEACCPVDYDCDCVYHGRHFQPGEKIDTGFPCDECYCDEHSRLKCKYKICERPLNASGCSPKYEKDKCCPVDYKCGETGSQIVMNRQSRIDNNQQPFISQSDRTSQGDSSQGNPPLQNGRLIIPLGNFENSQANPNFQTMQNENNRQQFVSPPVNNFPLNFNNNPSNQSSLTNRFQISPDQNQNFNQPITDGSATTVHQSFSVDNRPIVSLGPSASGMAATPFSNFDSTRTTGPSPFMITPGQQMTPNQPMNSFSNQFPTSNNQQFNTFSENHETDLPPNILMNGRVIGGPEMVENIIGKSCRERGRLLLTLDPCQYLVCGGIWVRTRPVCPAIPQHCTTIRAEGFCCPIIRCSDEFTIADIPPTPNMIHTPVSDSGPGQFISASVNPGQPQIKDGDACNEQSRLEPMDACQTLLCANRTVLSYIEPCPPVLQGCSLIRDQRLCCPINVKCVSNESNPVELVAMNRQNGQNSPTINSQAPSSFRPPDSNNGPSSFRPQGFEISRFGMAIIPTGDQLLQNSPFNNNNNNQFNMQPENSGREQFRNRPDNPIRNFQENNMDNHQVQQQNRFLNRQPNEGQANLNNEDHRGFPFHDSVGDQQGFPINRPHNENNSVPGLMSQTGFRPIFGGIPSVPISQPPENARDKAIQVVEPGVFRKPESTTSQSSLNKPKVISHNITEETIELNDTRSTPARNTKDTANSTNDSERHTTISTRSNLIAMSSTVSTSKPLLSTSHTINEASTDTSKTTDNPPILIPTFPPSVGGRGCRIGSTKFDDGSTVDVGNPCISCSCMDSGLWCVPNAKCAKS